MRWEVAMGSRVIWSGHVVGLLLLCIGCLGILIAERGQCRLDLGGGLEEDAAALLEFRKGIENDPSGALGTWRTGSNPCRWQGVVCGHSEVLDSEGSGRVVELDLWGLELEGSMSAAIGKLSELRKLTIVGNRFSGQIPAEIVHCQKLTLLDLRANDLSGHVGFSLASFPELRVLKLSENRITGTLNVLFSESAAMRKRYTTSDPFKVVTGLCPRLEVLDLAQNLLSGLIPTAVGRCAQLREVSLNDNTLEGIIPETFSQLPNLQNLLLSRNRLSGIISPAIAVGCKKLQQLDMAENRLRGHIPRQFADFSGARAFNFSNNFLQGPIPMGKWSVRQMAADGAFSGNSDLCGWPLSRECHGSTTAAKKDNRDRFGSKDPSHQMPASLAVKYLRLFAVVSERIKRLLTSLLNIHNAGKSRLAKAFGPRRSMQDAGAAAPTGSPSSSKKKSHTARKWALGLALGIIAGAITAALLATMLRLCIFYMHKAPYLQGPIIFHPNISPKMLLFLENDESLSTAEIVGQGAAGRVYKARLENEMVVAVKSVLVKEDQKGLFGQKQIQAELETLGCIRHRNLVVLLAYVHRPDCHLLLYEYMQNGSLHHALQKINAGELDLPWPVRHKIAVGASQGLSYLHFHSNPRIVHRDLKPSNILLDENFEAHVSDFGLAKVIPGEDTHVTTGVAGTVGYIAPEYSQTCRFTDKSDVYSFGVVLAVLLTGKDPTDQFFHTVPGGNIGRWLHDLLQKGEGRDAIDPKIRQPEYEEETLLAMKVAVFCTNTNPADRPSSKEILIMLNQIRNVEGVNVVEA